MTYSHDHSFVVDYGGFNVVYSPLFKDTVSFFGKYARDFRDSDADFRTLQIDQKFMADNRWLVSEDEQSDAFLEFQCLMLATGNCLLTASRALIHGVSFIWHDFAWILTAPSGTGKTTQYRYWRDLWRKEIRIINGDKPLLECRPDGTTWIHSSPWRGKEKLGMPGLQAKLGGIIMLEQGDHNEIRRLSPRDAVIPLWAEFVSIPENSAQIKRQAEILNQMLDAVPVWKLINIGDEDSAILTRNALTEYLEERYE